MTGTLPKARNNAIATATLMKA